MSEKDKIVVEECLALHDSGVKNSALSERYGCHPNSIRKFLAKHGRDTNGRDLISQEQKDIIIDLYNKKYSTKQIPKMLNFKISLSSVQRIVTESGLSRTIKESKIIQWNK